MKTTSYIIFGLLGASMAAAAILPPALTHFTHRELEPLTFAPKPAAIVLPANPKLALTTDDNYNSNIEVRTEKKVRFFISEDSVIEEPTMFLSPDWLDLLTVTVSGDTTIVNADFHGLKEIYSNIRSDEKVTIFPSVPPIEVKVPTGMLQYISAYHVVASLAHFDNSCFMLDTTTDVTISDSRFGNLFITSTHPGRYRYTHDVRFNDCTVDHLTADMPHYNVNIQGNPVIGRLTGTVSSASNIEAASINVSSSATVNGFNTDPVSCRPVSFGLTINDGAAYTRK
ncbi:MAG: hypothetical protein NC098_07545 [Lachnoclostridium sp.]|nr:hypothetical protein [Lachnoclostridium sp.]